MKERQYNIIQLLLYSVSPIQLDDIQKNIGVSERTLKYDLATIRKEFRTQGIKLLNKKGMGYYISPDDKPVIIKKYALEKEAETQNDGFYNILMYLLLIKNPSTTREIAEKLYVSEAIVKQTIKERLANSKQTHLVELNDGKSVSLINNERELREAYVSTIFNKMEKFDRHEVTMKFENVIPYFQEQVNMEGLHRVERIFQKSVKKWSVWISEEAYVRLVLHLFIVYLRKGQSLKYSAYEIKLFKQFEKEFHFSKEVLHAGFWGIIDRNEILNLTEVMAEHNVFIDDSIEEENEERLNKVVETMLQCLSDKYPTYSVNQSDFIEDVTPHFRHTLRRHYLGAEENKNPLFYQIKQNYKQYYSIAKELYVFFSDEFQMPLSENEVSYLTIYLYKNMSMKVEKKYYVYVVCGTGRGFSKLLENRISNIFENLEIIDTLSSFHLLQQKEVSKADFIISTIHLSDIEIPVIKISSFLGKEDIDQIHRFLDYGAQFSLLPLPQNESHFSRDAKEGNRKLTKADTETFSNALLYLFQMMVDLPSEYDINQEKILGITMHLVIALPRYYEADSTDDDKELIKEVMKIEKEHPVVAKVVTEYLEMIENIVGKGIPYGERYAMYQYIINKGD